MPENRSESRHDRPQGVGLVLLEHRRRIMFRFGAYVIFITVLLGCASVSPNTREIKALEQQAQFRRLLFAPLPASVATQAEQSDTISNSEAASTAWKAAFALLSDIKMVLVRSIAQLSCEPVEIQDHATCSYAVKMLRFGRTFKDGRNVVEFKNPQEITEVKQNVGFTRNAEKWTMDQQ